MSLALLPTLTLADFVFTPEITTGVMNYKWEEGEGLNPNIDIDEPLSDNLLFLGIGGTISVDRLFINGYLQKTLEGEDTSSGRVENIAPSTVNIVSNSNFDRQDYSISFGYAITGNFSTFAGYRKSKQAFDVPSTSNIKSEGSPLPPGLTFAGDFEYETKGPFVGIAYGWALGKGLVALNFAVARLDVDLDSHYTITGRDPIVSSNSGNAIGMTMGVGWQGQIVGNLRYKVSLNGYQYDFDVLKERVISLQAGLRYSFY